MYMVSSRTFCWLVGVEVSWSQHHWPSGSNWSGVFVLVGSIQLTSPTWQGFQYLQDSSEDISENIISSPGGGTKGLWLCLMAKLLFCLLNCFPLLLHLLISLIKVICWLFFFFYWQEAGRGHVSRGPILEGPIGSCSVTFWTSVYMFPERILESHPFSPHQDIMRPEAPTVYTKTYRDLHLKKNLHKEDISHYREHIYHLEIC